jgi:hypothetical protein
MNGLGPEAREFLRAADAAERRMRLSHADRLALRHGLASRLGQKDRSTNRRAALLAAIPARLAGALRAAAAALVALSVGAPAWASVAICLALGGGIGGAMSIVHQRVAARVERSVDMPPNPAVTTLPTIPLPAATHPSPAETIGDVSITESFERAKPAAPSRPSSAPSRPVEPSGGRAVDSTLGEEAALLQSAQEAIRDRDGPRALYRLDEYMRRFPDGALLMEASAARVIATCELGDAVRGRALAAEFVRHWPHAPVVARMAVACDEGTTSP